MLTIVRYYGPDVLWLPTSVVRQLSVWWSYLKKLVRNYGILFY